VGCLGGPCQQHVRQGDQDLVTFMYAFGDRQDVRLQKQMLSTLYLCNR
jgi:hypothetical protein